MSKPIVFATANQHKVLEVNRINDSVEFISLTDIGITDAIPETGTTFRENAEQKARYVFDRTGHSVVAEDSGLVVEALDGAPGIYSARYAGEEKNHAKNMEKLLHEMTDKTDRSAHYQATICLIDRSGRAHFFEGQCPGTIATSQSGTGGFGYDPVFIPNGFRESFGILAEHVKDQISHRKKAFERLFAYLETESFV